MALVPHHLFFCHDDRTALTGPFYGENAFNAGMVAQYQDIRDMKNQHDFKTRFYARNHNKVLSGHKPTLTHSDVQRKNIIVKATVQEGDQQRRKFEIALVDCEVAGWYPDYWDYFIMFVTFRWKDDWRQKAEEFLTAWPAESAMMRMVYTDLWF